MQAVPAMAVMPKNPGNAAKSAGLENDSASIEGVDFSSMLKAQIKGSQVVDAEIKAHLDAVSVELAPVDVGVPQELDSLSGKELVPSDGLIPLAGFFVPVPVDAGKRFAPPVLEAAPSGKTLEGVKRDSEVLAGTEPLVAKAGSPEAGGLAEFAVDDEILPQGRAEKGSELLRQPVISVESPRMPEVSASTLSALAAANQPAVVETKSALPSPATLQAPVGSSGWGDALGQKVVWMAGQQTQVAELRLNPPHLGPMEVRLSVSNDQISALFVSHQPAVREAIEAAMPRLREMFADSGLTLGNATVSSDSLPQQQTSGREGQSGSSRQPGFSAVGGVPSPQNIGGMIPLRQDGSGMVDLFA